MYKRILVATDGSELSHKAVDHAIGLAALCQAELIAVTVVPHYPRSYFDGSLPLTNDEVERVEKHWSEGGHKILETVQTAAKAQGVTLSVENTGTGIPQGLLPKLFDRFYRADPSRQRKGDGAGLGLAIVKSIIDAHGGTITAFSENEMVSFVIMLPISD